MKTRVGTTEHVEWVRRHHTAVVMHMRARGLTTLPDHASRRLRRRSIDRTHSELVRMGKIPTASWNKLKEDKNVLSLKRRQQQMVLFGPIYRDFEGTILRKLIKVDEELRR